MTAKENVELASEIVSDALDPEAVLKEVGLGNRLDNFPCSIVRRRATTGGDRSGSGEKSLKILLCDEPTGALDYQTGKQVLGILQDMSRKRERRSSS